jgi:hypothetical protein
MSTSPLESTFLQTTIHFPSTCVGRGSTDTPADTLHKEMQAAFKVMMTR